MELFLIAAVLLVETAGGSPIPILNIDPSTQVVPVSPGPGQYWGFNESHGNGMIGWTFTLFEPVTVTGVGWYDQEKDGLSRAFQVGLWHDFWMGPNPPPPGLPPPPQLLGDSTSGLRIPGGTQARLDGAWRVVDLETPLVLQPNFYELGGLDSATTPDVIKYVYMSGDDPEVTETRLSIGPFFYAFGYPYLIDGQFHSVGADLFYLNYGLELGPILFIDVPEPAISVVVTGSSLLLLAMRRCRQQGTLAQRS